MTATYQSAKDLIVEYIADLYKDEANELAWIYEHGGEKAALNWIRNEGGAKVMQVRNKWIIIE